MGSGRIWLWQTSIRTFIRGNLAGVLHTKEYIRQRGNSKDAIISYTSQHKFLYNRKTTNWAKLSCVLNHSMPFRESLKRVCLTKVCGSDPVGAKNSV